MVKFNIICISRAEMHTLNCCISPRSQRGKYIDLQNHNGITHFSQLFRRDKNYFSQVI